MKRLVLCGALMCGVAVAAPPDQATVTRLQSMRAAVVLKLDEIPAERLLSDPAVPQLVEQMVQLDREIAGESGDAPLEAIQAHRNREMLLKLLADRAQRAKASQAAMRQTIGTEKRDKSVIDAIARAIAGASGVKLLDVDAGADTNRTVYTFVGAPAAVAEAAYRGALAAGQLIDM